MKKIVSVFLVLLMFAVTPVTQAQVPKEHLMERVFNAIYPFHHDPKLTMRLVIGDKRAIIVFADYDDVRIIGDWSTEVMARHVVCATADKIANGVMSFALMWPVRAHLFSNELKWVGSVEIGYLDCSP